MVGVEDGVWSHLMCLVQCLLSWCYRAEDGRECTDMYIALLWCALETQIRKTKSKAISVKSLKTLLFNIADTGSLL